MSDYYLAGSHRQYHDRDFVWHLSENAQYFPADEIVTIEGEMRRSGMDKVEVVRVPIYAELDNGETIDIKNRYALMVTGPQFDKPTFLRRVVGNRYEPMQNLRLAEILEPLQRHWPLEGTMIVKQGEITIVQLKIDQFHVGNYDNEEHQSYLTVASDHTQGGLMWLRTNVRTVCWNTYSLSMRALDKLRIPHNDNADTILQFLAAVEEQTIAAQKLHTEQLNGLFTRKIDKIELATIVDAAFPEPKETSRQKIAGLSESENVTGEVATDFFALVDADKKRGDWATERQKSLRVAVGANYSKFNDEQPYAAGTAYGAFQAVTETVNYSSLFKGNREKQAVSLLMGQKAKIQASAWGAAVDLLEG